MYIKETYSHIRGSFKTMMSNPLFILSSFFVDLLFFFLFGIVYSFFSSGLIEKLMEVNSIIGELNSQLSAITAGAEDSAILSSVMQQESVIMEHVKAIAFYAAAILISTYILWCVFQGISWHIASWISSRKKTHFLRFLGKFSLLNLVWLAGVVFIAYITYKLSVYNAMTKIALVSQDVINYSLLFMAFVLFYFAVVSYSFVSREGFLGSLKNAFVLGVKRAKSYAFAYFFVALIVVLIYSAVSLLKLGLVASVLMNIVLMLPVFAYGRVLFLGISGSAGLQHGNEKEKLKKKDKHKKI